MRDLNEMEDYLKWIRSKVGKERIFLNFAGGLVENDKGEILLQKRTPTDELWGFPGGIMNLGESAEEAAIREIKEETGYNVEAKELLGVYTKFFDTFPNGDKSQSIVFFFRMKIIGGERKVDEIETFDIKFFPIKEIPYLYSNLHRVILEDIRSGKTGVFR